MISNEFINETLGIQEAFKLPERLYNLLFSDDRNEIFEKFLNEESDLSYDWFTDYFQNEHGDRKNLKQDYTPDCVSSALIGITPLDERVADICAGTGGLTIKAWTQSPNSFFYAEEFSERVLPILLFNLAIRNIDSVVWHGDSLSREQKGCYRLTPGERFSDIEEIEAYVPEPFDSIIMNPPYSLKWSEIKEPRFEVFGIAPKSKADFAFIEHGYSMLSETGTLSAILPHGVLFRGSKEEKIRKNMIEANVVDAVIGLPEKLFLNTSIPVAFITLKKNREKKGIYIADTSKEFEKRSKQNYLSNDQVQKIIDCTLRHYDVERYGRFVPYDEIIENDYNLNIPRYVNSNPPSPPINLEKEIYELIEIEKEGYDIELHVVNTCLNDLTGFSPEQKDALKTWKTNLITLKKYT